MLLMDDDDDKPQTDNLIVRMLSGSHVKRAGQTEAHFILHPKIMSSDECFVIRHKLRSYRQLRQNHQEEMTEKEKNLKDDTEEEIDNSNATYLFFN